MLRQPDERLYRTLVERHQQRVLRLVASVLGPGAWVEAEDIAQEVFVRAFERLASVREVDHFGRWLTKIAYHFAIDARRRIDRFANLQHEVLRAEGHRAGLDLRLAVLSAMERLPTTQRAVVHLHYWLGLTVEEVAGTLDIPSGTVKSHLVRGRRVLAGLLEEERR